MASSWNKNFRALEKEALHWNASHLDYDNEERSCRHKQGPTGQEQCCLEQHNSHPGWMELG